MWRAVFSSTSLHSRASFGNFEIINLAICRFCYLIAWINGVSCNLSYIVGTTPLSSINFINSSLLAFTNLLKAGVPSRSGIEQSAPNLISSEAISRKLFEIAKSNTVLLV